MTLDEALGSYDGAFQAAVHQPLLEEGFELESGLPNLQPAKEIREAVGGLLENTGWPEAGESFRLFLEWADRQGILLDLGLNPDHWPATA